MKKLFIFFAILIFHLVGYSQESIITPEQKLYGTGEWNADSLGNHRVIIKVNENADALLAHIPWRRRDFNPGEKDIIILDSKTGKRIENLFRLDINREFGDIIFQPKSVPGEYYIYYMPFITKGVNYPKVTYKKPMDRPDKNWINRNNLSDSTFKSKKLKSLPQAEIIQFQSIDMFNSFYPMEIIATKDEVNSLINKNPDYLLFSEDRIYPIRMTSDLPYKWIKDGLKNQFEGNADKGEYYVFQIGLYAVIQDIEDIDISFSELKNENIIIDSKNLTCFNKTGTDWKGNRFSKICSIKEGKVQPLWIGIQIPKEIISGKYFGEVTIKPKGLLSKKIDLTINVSNKILEDFGDSEPWRHSRLRWLNSTLAEDNEVVKPFTPLKKKGNIISLLGREIIINRNGLPENIKSYFSPEMTEIQKNGRKLLSSPLQFVIERKDKTKYYFESNDYKITDQSDGMISWESKGKINNFDITLSCKLEFDGFIDYSIKITSLFKTDISDIRLEIPFENDIAKYSMGMGLKGGLRPENFEWKWDVKKNHDAIWIGDVNSGMQISLKDETYSRPLNTNFYLLKPLNMPISWYNSGKGGFSFKETDENSLLMTAFSGERTIDSGETLNFNFSLLLTPFKTLDTKGQWNTRYYHAFKPIDEIAKTGANTINTHHANSVNPYINYPFLRPDEMKNYINEAHQKGMKVKIYYTVRELSNRTPELFALRSLNDEIFFPGNGGGFSWLQEHLDSTYIAAWFVPELKDAAIINSGVSRWHNYYVEGLNWLVKNIGIDGLYIDDVAFDRIIMKRVRKILDRNNTGSLIDLHSANQYNVRDGFVNSANLYLEHFPYLNRLWFGEYFDYNSNPDFWLIEVSGIPFGLMGEMLEKGGNPWRGMLYGMTSRLPWAGDPREIWKTWDEFGIQESKMFGYWSPNCPIKTTNKDILSTGYIKKDKVLISIASWAENPVECRLNIDWKKLGFDPNKMILIAPEMKDFQPAKSFEMNDKIPVQPGKGWLLILTRK